MIKKIIYLTSALILFVNPVFSEKLKKISITGLHRVEPKAVEDYLKIKIGDEILPEKIEESLKRLYETGWFADVRPTVENAILSIKVVENPTVNQISFEGNDKISDEILKAEVQIKPRQIFTVDAIKKETQRILEIYQRKGRYAATVDPKIIKRDQNRVDVIFVMQEGVMTNIQTIRFVGAQKFSQDELELEIHSREARWYRFLTATDTYDPERVETDKYALKKFYAKKGYINLAVASGIAELFPDKSGFLLTFMIEEGKRYKVKEIDYKIKIPGVKFEQIKVDSPVVKGEWYNGDFVEKTKVLLTDKLGDLGYAFVNIEHKYEIIPGTQDLHLTFNIEESAKIYIERIEISGNTKTLESVIRREVLLKEGDPFNLTKIRTSLKNIQNLGFFKVHKIRHEQAKGSSANKMILKIFVEEEATLEMNIGVGYDSAAGSQNWLNGVLGTLKFGERNFLGYGIDTRIQGKRGKEDYELSVGAGHPHLFGYRFGGGAELFNIYSDRARIESYADKKAGGNVYVRYGLAEDLMQKITYTCYEQTMTLKTDPTNPKRVPSKYIVRMVDQGKTNTISQISLGTFYDKRDSAIDPTAGYALSLTNDFAGLVGGTISFFKNELKGVYHIPVTETIVLNLRAGGGIVWGDSLRIIDTFQKGGSNDIHGFETWGIGPRVATTVLENADSLGGTKYYMGAAEFSIPIGGPELGAKFLLYTEVGNLWDCGVQPLPGETMYNEFFNRVSVGAGIAFTIPFVGRIRLDWAKAIRYTDYDKQQNFSFGMDYKI